MDKKQLQEQILQQPYHDETWQRVLKEYFGAKVFHTKPVTVLLPSNDIAESAVELGNFYTADERVVGMYEVQLKPKPWIQINRVGLRSLLRQVYKHDVDAALIVFVQGDKWRFSYVSEIRTEEGIKETEPKRYTYLFGTGETSRTAADRFDKLKGKPVSLDDLFEAFSVEKLNKDFFKTYKEFFEQFSEHLAGNKSYRKTILNNAAYLEKGWKDAKAKPIRDFTKKLLGRIVFLQFLQKKGWMGCPVLKTEKENEEIWTGGNTAFLQMLFNHVPDKENFHSKYLRTLFFQTLNLRRKNQLFAISLPDRETNKNEKVRVPYLNGGLFDTDISFEHDFDFPVDLFKRLLEFFERYNFTIDENDPYDSEVGIDPEMLGHIFENLLEENREKGAFYTPKEIVHYMCQESLIQYLRTHLPECTEDESPSTKTIEKLIRYGETGDRNDKKNYIVQKAKRIEKLLDNVKICDPAIGSGAFPMGILQEILNAKNALDLTLDRARAKKNIIQNTIYGVDLDKGAVDIARLRFWLALVVDEDKPQPLPNLDYKIMQGNSLLESFEGIDLSKSALFEEPKVTIFNPTLFTGFVEEPQLAFGFSEQNQSAIKKLMNQYFTEENKEKKEELHQKIDRIVLDHIDASLEGYQNSLLIKIAELEKSVKRKKQLHQTTVKEEKAIEAYEKQMADKENARKKLIAFEKTSERPYFLWHVYFEDVMSAGGFDILIGNPPYIQLQKDGGELAKALQGKGYETFERTGDIYALFYELGYNLLKLHGTLTYISGSSWLRSNYGKALRKFFLEKTNGKILIDLSDAEVFESATILTTIHIYNKEKNQKQLKALRLTRKNQTMIRDLAANFGKQNVVLKRLDENAWVISDSKKQTIKGKVGEVGKKLKDWNIEINRGIITGLNEAFVIDDKKRKELIEEDKRSAEIIKPILRGRDIGKYKYNFANLYLINAHNGIKEKGLQPININNYPAIEKHLKPYKKELEKRQDQGDNWFNLRNCTFLDEFEKPKIIYPNMVKDISFAYDDEGFYTNQKCFILTGENLKYLLAIFNSKLFRYCFEDEFPELQGNSREINKVVLKQIPVAEVPKNETQYNSLVEKIIELKKQNLDSSKWENKIDALVFVQYQLTLDEMIQVLDSFEGLSIETKNQIINEYQNIALGKFKLEV
ncbi:MAG TPA: TaqI-like C-terminal specificity domain-containing protein [Bacteroidia bacterium]|nr:TaqI-like C-terminal specificity domain-containing protein [Bacteroidia bacterium]HNU33635.1 TaqI-like C-terminal specificity domain-containing protein [Bacteroidia bacterium]